MPNKILEFVGKKKKSKPSKRGKVIDSGMFGELEYEIYERGVIHVSTKASKLLFKKDTILFEEEMNKFLTDLEDDMADTVLIKGSGENDHLELKFDPDKSDIVFTLKKREFNSIERMKNILNRAKSKIRRPKS